MSSSNVSFNVGWKLFEVGRPLLDKYPDSMMLRVLGDLADNEKTDPIFIDRDSTRFGYILDYMRDGKVTLPITISKDSFVSDLNYYGIGQKNENKEVEIENNLKSMCIGLHANTKTLQDLDERIRFFANP